MRNSIQTLAALVLFLFAGAHSASWYRIPLGTFSKIEEIDGFIRIMAPDDARYPVLSLGSASTWANATTPTKDEIHIYPPVGKDKIWMAMILAAASSSGQIAIHANEYGSVLKVESGHKPIMSILP